MPGQPSPAARQPKAFQMGACLRKPPSAPVVIEPEDALATALAADDLTKPPNALHVRIIRARDLPAVDTNLLSKNSSDPYVLLSAAAAARTTTKEPESDMERPSSFLGTRAFIIDSDGRRCGFG